MNCTYRKLNLATGSYLLGMFNSSADILILNVCCFSHTWVDGLTFGTAITAKLRLWIFIEAVQDVCIICA